MINAHTTKASNKRERPPTSPPLPWTRFISYLCSLATPSLSRDDDDLVIIDGIQNVIPARVCREFPTGHLDLLVRGALVTRRGRRRVPHRVTPPAIPVRTTVAAIETDRKQKKYIGNPRWYTYS